MDKRSKLVDKNTYVKWYNFAKDEIKDEKLIPERTKEEIFGLVSRENWLMFGLKGEDKDEATLKPEPNIFFDILSKEGNLTGLGRLGLAFNNLGSYDKFKNIMRGINKESKEKITKVLLGLSKSWDIRLTRKIKRYNYAQTPEYKEEGRWSSNKIDEKIIDELIQKAKEIREEGISHREQIRISSGNPKKFYTETPNITLMELEFKLTEEEFRDRIVEIFKVLTLCLGVKSNVEANKINRQKVKELSKKQEELEILNKELPNLKKLEGVVSGINSEVIKQREEEKRQLEAEIEKLESEIED